MVPGGGGGGGGGGGVEWPFDLRTIESIEDCIDAILVWNIEVKGFDIYGCKGVVFRDWGAL